MQTRLYNPYDSRRPAAGSRFIGREAEIAEITSGANNIIVFGYSRWGKTSLLKRAASLVQGELSDAIYISNTGSDSAELTGSIKQSMNPTLAEKFGQTQYLSLNELLRNMDTYYTSEGRKLFIFLDETADLFRDAKATQDFRAYNQDFHSLVFVYSIFPHVFEQMQKDTSRFQDTAKMVPLVPFDYEHTKDLVELCTDGGRIMAIDAQNRRTPYVIRPFTVEEGIRRKVFDATGGLPFLIQGLMGELVDVSSSTASPTELTDEKFQSAYAGFRLGVREQLSHFWNGLTTLQKQILGIISTEEGITGDNLLSRVNPENPSVWLGGLNPLLDTKGMGIITTGKQGGYSIRGEIINEALRYFFQNFERPK